MPKENTNGVIIDDTVGSGFRTEVSWRPDRDGDGSGHVQIATTNQHSPFRWEMLPDDKGEQGGKLDGWFVTLDRDGINRLIRSLRRARDAAYGADA